MPKEGFEPLPDPRQSFLRPDGSKRPEVERARTQLTTSGDPLRQGFGKVHEPLPLRVNLESLMAYAPCIIAIPSLGILKESRDTRWSFTRLAQEKVQSLTNRLRTGEMLDG